MAAPESAASAEAWLRLQRGHFEAVERFLALARAVPREQWPTAPAPGKWSPAEVAQHVASTYRALLRELSGGGAMRLRTKWWQRVLLRSVLLPRILRTGRIPPGAVAPRELRPGPVSLEQAAMLDELRSQAVLFDAELGSRPAAARLTHPYFGRLDAAQVLRFCAVHTNHHARQLEKYSEGAAARRS